MATPIEHDRLSLPLRASVWARYVSAARACFMDAMPSRRQTTLVSLPWMSPADRKALLGRRTAPLPVPTVSRQSALREPDQKRFRAATVCGLESAHAARLLLCQ